MSFICFCGLLVPFCMILVHFKRKITKKNLLLHKNKLLKKI